MRKNTKPVQSENLTSGQLFFKKRFYLVGLREQLCLQNDKKLLRQKYTKQLKRRGGGGAKSPLHPNFRRKGFAPDPLHPSLDTGLGQTYIIILFLSNLHMHSNVTVLPIKQNYNIFPNLHAYNFPSS